MRRFVTKDSKKDFYILYTLAFALFSGFILSVFPQWEISGVES